MNTAQLLRKVLRRAPPGMTVLAVHTQDFTGARAAPGGDRRDRGVAIPIQTCDPKSFLGDDLGGDLVVGGVGWGGTEPPPIGTTSGARAHRLPLLPHLWT